MIIEEKLPELGDGIESGDVLEVLVSEGDVIAKEQGLVELETDKATVEVPSSSAGKITKVHVTTGETVKIGATLVSVELQEAAPSPPSSGGTPPSTDQDKTREAETAKPVPDQPSPPPPSPPPKSSPPKSSPPPKPAERVSQSSEEPESVDAEAAANPRSTPEATVPAGPAVRRFAREVGVDLGQVAGSGKGGRITRDDVLAAVRKASKAQQSKSAGEPAEADEWGPIRTEKMARIRRTIASKMVDSWTSVPRVTNYDDADVTELERIRQASKADYSAQGIKLTAMPFVIKAVALALRGHPLVNAALDVEGQSVIYKEYVNIGIAVDTDRGLVVPSLRKADDLSISEIAGALAKLAAAARDGTFEVADLRGSTFTISNLGAVGGTYSTPIINVPEVAILLLGRSRKMPVVMGDEIQVRLMMPLSLSYDHRLVDGATAARFLNDVISFLTAPSRLLLAP